MKKAFITGITGQDGAYLAKLLLSKGYKVSGGYRRQSIPGFDRLDELGIRKHVNLVESDLLDVSNLIRVIEDEKPQEVYNLAAQSFVGYSFKNPIVTGNVTGLGVLNILEAIRIVDRGIRFYQASTSELYGLAKQFPQNEDTPFHPRSPYGNAKLYGHWATINYRESYNIFAVAGILFNHESPLRGLEFVTRKISNSVARIHLGLQDYLEIGSLDAKRDWGYAPEYVEAMWKMLQNETPRNYVLATGECHSVREWIDACFAFSGTKITWEGERENEIGRDSENGKILIKVNPKFYRPAEIYELVGDSSLAKRELGWQPKVKFEQLVEIMMAADLKKNQK
jgi:GDPmannose 4,6-dehydratase